MSKIFKKIVILLLMMMTIPALSKEYFNISNKFQQPLHWVPFGNSGLTNVQWPVDVDLVFSKAGTPFIKYFGGWPNSVGVMTLKNGKWVSIKMPKFKSSTNISGGNIAISPSGQLYLALFSVSNNINSLQLMKYNSSSWENVGKPALGISNHSSSHIFAISKSGVPFIAVSPRDSIATHKIHVMKFFNGKWVNVGGGVITLDDADTYTLSLDSKDFPYLAALKGSYPLDSIKILKFNGKDWKEIGNRIDTPPNNSGDNIGFSFTVSSKGVPYIAFQNYVKNKNGLYLEVNKLDLKNNTWIPVGDTNLIRISDAAPSLKIDTDEKPIVAVVQHDPEVDPNQHKPVHWIVMRLTKNNKWIDIGMPTSFGSSYSGWPAHLRFDQEGKLYVLYHDSNYDSQLSVARLDGA